MPQIVTYGHSLMLSDDWDLQLNTAGQIDVCSGAYAVAQNVSNAIRLFTDDAYFNPERGIPHFAIELGRRPALSVLRARIKEAAENVAGVRSAIVVDLNIESDRTLTGDIELTLLDGSSFNLSL